MYKSKLQELCAQRRWSNPNYSTNRDGPDHCPRFKASVIVNGISFDSPDHSKSSKEAQAEAARVAFQHFVFPPLPTLPSSPSSGSGSLSSRTELNSDVSGGGTLLGKSQETKQSTPLHGHVSGVKDDKLEGSLSARTELDINSSDGGELLQSSQETNHGNVSGVKDKPEEYLHKSRLQNYSHKRGLSLPVYSCVREGPPHAALFKATVAVDGQTFESPEFLYTVKDAEHAAAKTALSLLLKDGNHEAESIYKNLLQDLALKESFSAPVYNTTRYGASHTPIFVSSVEVEGDIFCGTEARSKKQAEMNAAKVAYSSLKQRSLSANTKLKNNTSDGGTLRQNNQGILQNAPLHGNVSGVKHDKLEECSTIYKSRLQELCHQMRWSYPSYSSSRDGPDHCPHFKASVFVNGVSFDSPNFCKSSKDAQIEAARIAYQHLVQKPPSHSPSSQTSSSAGDSRLPSLLSNRGQVQAALKCISTLSIRSDERKDEDREANSAEMTTKIVTASADCSTHSPSKPSTSSTPRNIESTSSDMIYPRLRDPFPSKTLSLEDVTSSPTTASQCFDRALEYSTGDYPMAASSLLCNRVRVYPCKPNITFPKDVTLLPFSDDKWVAVRLDFPNRQGS